MDEMGGGSFECMILRRWWRGGLPLQPYFRVLFDFIKNNTPKNTPINYCL